MLIPSFVFKRLFWFILAFLSSSQPLLSYSSYSNPHSQESKGKWLSQTYLQSPHAIDFAFNIGLGLLYFHKTKGNLSPIPPPLFSQFDGVNFGPIARLGYNRTPVFEAQIGYKIFSWLKASLVYEGQSGVSVESQFNSTRSNTTQRPAWACFRSNLQLNAMLIKVMAQVPSAYRLGSWAFSPYMAMGVGPCWQSWTSPSVYLMTLNAQGSLSSVVLSLNQKITAHALWMGELGLNIQPAQKNAPFTLQVGCKYVDWGSSGSIGVQQAQGGKLAPFKPVSIQKVYSFIPFIGIQFNF